MSIFMGNSKLDEMYIGEDRVGEIYVDGERVYQRVEGPPIGFRYMLAEEGTSFFIDPKQILLLDEHGVDIYRMGEGRTVNYYYPRDAKWYWFDLNFTEYPPKMRMPRVYRDVYHIKFNDHPYNQELWLSETDGYSGNMYKAKHLGNSLFEVPRT